METLKKYQPVLRSLVRNTGRIIGVGWRVIRWLWLAVIVMRLAQALLPLANAFLAGQIINAIVDALAHHNNNTTHIFVLVVIVGLIQFASGLITMLSSYIDQVGGYRFDLYTQAQLYDKFTSLDFSYFEDNEFNKKLTKVDENRMAVRGYLGNLVDVGAGLVTLLSTGAALAFLNPWLLMVVVVTLLPTSWVEATTTYKRWRSWDNAGDDWRRVWWLRNVLLNPDVVKDLKILGLPRRFIDYWKEAFAGARGMEIAIERRAQKFKFLAQVADSISEIGIQIWLLTKVLAANSHFGLGNFQFYRQVVQNFSSGASGLVQQLRSLQENALYVDDYFSLLELEPRLPLAANPVKLPTDQTPRIEFDNVSFRYPGTKDDIFRDFSMVIEPGEDIALVGENGSGKTTLLKLLLRFYDPDQGRILVGGYDLREVDLESWYYHVGLLFQDFPQYSIFPVAQGIEFGRAAETPELPAVRAAAHKADADKFIEQYPKKYEQILNRWFSDGVEPSGGQWQRLALARTFFRGASVLVLDEPTSAIDARGEYEIFQTINQTQVDKTTIIISHRFSTVRHADKIYVIEKGRVKEHGSHEQLMQIAGGTYRDMFELQAEGYR